MRTFILNKLVRDNIVTLMLEQGQNPQSHTFPKAELPQALHHKLLEESRELNFSNPDELVGELADIQEVLDAIAAVSHITKAAIAEKQAKKRAKAGGFADGIFVEQVAVPADSEWAEYYAKEPDRFTEI